MTKFWRLILVLFVFVLIGETTQAQPFPGAVFVNGGWVPCTHPIAISAGLGCVGPTPITSPMVVGRFYRNVAGNCEIKVLALAKTFFHQRSMLIAETMLKIGCPDNVLFFDPYRAPDGNWFDITEQIPAYLR